MNIDIDLRDAIEQKDIGGVLYDIRYKARRCTVSTTVTFPDETEFYIRVTAKSAQEGIDKTAKLCAFITEGYAPL